MLNAPTEAFLLGGGALVFYGLKEGTKDVDVIYRTKDEVEITVKGLHELGYRDKPALPKVYREMGTVAVVENSDGFRWDIYHTRVVNALVLSNGMVPRSTTNFFHKGKLRVHLISREDVFIFKSVTNREGDLDDMRRIAEAGPDWDVILSEIMNQSDSSGIVWENSLYENLKELREKHGIASPIETRVQRVLSQKIDELAVIRAVQKGKKTVDEICKSSRELTPSIVRQAIRRLERKSRITVDRTKRPFEFCLPEEKEVHIELH